MSVYAAEVAREVLKVVPGVMGTIRKEMRSYRGAMLSVMQFRALVYIDHHPKTSLSSVADHLGLTLPTVSTMVDGMVDSDLVMRNDSAADRRRVELSLTTSGQNLLTKAVRGTEKRLEDMLTPLEPHQLEQVYKVMQLFEYVFSAAKDRQPSLER
jgi:DNA-binding MarR family transcriptional regulator